MRPLRFSDRNARRKQLLYVMNPNKFHVAEFLMRSHEARGEKTLIFSDQIAALRHYATALQRPFIDGATPEAERQKILNAFKTTSTVNTIIISKVGDTSIDLPEASVIVQPVNFLQNTFSDRTRCIAQLRPGSSFLLSVLRFFDRP